MSVLLLGLLVLGELPPLARDPASVTVKDLLSHNQPPPLREALPEAPSPLVAVVGLVLLPWPVFADETRPLREAMKARIDAERATGLRTVDESEIFRERALHLKTGATCAGRYASPLSAFASAWAFAHTEMACPEASEECQIDVVVRGPHGMTSTPFAELLRLRAPVRRGADVAAIAAAIHRSKKVPVVAVDGKKRGGNVSFGSGSRDPVANSDTKLVRAQRFANDNRVALVDPAVSAKIDMVLRACRAEGVTTSTTSTFQLGKSASSATTRCEERGSSPTSTLDAVAQCICRVASPFVADGERWLIDVRCPTSSAADVLPAFFLPEVVSSTDPRFTGGELQQAAIDTCLADMKPTTHLWRRQRVTIDASGHVTQLESEGSPLPTSVAACWDDTLRATRFGCPVERDTATLDVVYHVFPYGTASANADRARRSPLIERTGK